MNLPHKIQARSENPSTGMFRVILAIFLITTSCSRLFKPARAEESATGYHRSIVDRSAAPEKLDAVPAADLPRVVGTIYRIRPDRRFVNAAADIVEITSGKKVDSVAINFVDGRWQVSVENRVAMALPELATFHDALAAVAQWAAAQQAPQASLPADVTSAVEREIANFYPRYLFAAFAQLEKASGGKLPEARAAAAAAKAAALLASQVRDEFDLADPLRGRGLALLAIAKSLDARCCADTEALIASVLGYETEAAQVAAELPDGYAKAFVTGSDIAARDRAAQALLLVRRLHSEPLMPDSENQKPFRGQIDLEAAPQLLENNVFGNDWAFGAAAMSLILQSMESDPPATVSIDEESLQDLVQANPGRLTAKFESRLKTHARKVAGRLLDERSVLSFYDANWYAAARQPYAHYVYQQGAPDAAAEYVKELKPSTAAGKQVADWMSRTVAAIYGRGSYFERGGPASLNLLGGAAKYQLVKDIERSAGSSNPDYRRTARAVLPLLDSRPVETLYAGKLADFPLGNLERRDVYLKSAVDRAPRRLADEKVEYFYSVGDVAGLRAFAADTTLPPDDRMAALSRIGDLDPKANLHADYERVFAETGYKEGCLFCYFAYANKTNQPKLKERIARTYLEKNPDINPILEANVVSAIAKALEAQGRYEEGWKLVEPRLRVYSANILAIGVSLLQRLGRNDEAIKLGYDMLDRYPSGDMYSDFAPVLWRMRRFDEVGALFDASKRSFSVGAVGQEFPQAFVRSFSDAQIADAVTAFDALIAAKAPVSLLIWIAGRASEEKRHALALALSERLAQAPMVAADAGTQLYALTTGYDAMRELNGNEPAMRWFLQRMPADKAGNQTVLVNLLQSGKYDLLTRLIEAHPPSQTPGSHPLAVASLVASALALERVPISDDRWKIVRMLMPSATPSDGVTMHTSVRYLMHEATSAEVNGAAKNAYDRSEAPYFIGVRAAAEGDYDTALTHFLAAAEGPAGYPTVSMALTRLYVWRAKHLPWSEIRRQRLL